MIEAPWAKIPLSLTRVKDITLADIKVYCALDYLCGKSAKWYGPQEKIADRAGTSIDSVERAISKLRKHGYIETEKKGMAYQNVLQYFIRARVLAVGGDRTDDGTPTAEKREVDTRTDAADKNIETNTETKTAAVLPPPSKIFSLYENLCGSLTPYTADVLQEAEGEYPAEWIEAAFQEATENNVRRWKYVAAILKRWQQEGFRSKTAPPAAPPADPYVPNLPDGNWYGYVVGDDGNVVLAPDPREKAK